MATYREHFNKLPKAQRDAAIKNVELGDKSLLDREVNTLGEALLAGFMWNTTTEGYDFWEDIYESVENLKERVVKKEVLKDRAVRLLKKEYKLQEGNTGFCGESINAAITFVETGKISPDLSEEDAYLANRIKEVGMNDFIVEQEGHINNLEINA